MSALRMVAEAAWNTTCDSVKWAIGASIEGPRLARVSGKTAAQVKIEFYTELARECYIAGYERDRADAGEV